MKFGPRPPEQAVGWTLAHAVHVGAERWAKGLELSADHAARARAAGLQALWVARADAGDVAEAEAAAELGALLAGAGVEARPPVHGRANLYAARAGLLSFDRSGVDRWNLLQDEVAIATALPGAPVVAGQLVATVKVIPFAVSRETMAALKASPSAALAVMAWRQGLSAALIQTVHPGTPAKMLDKTEAVTARRLQALGMALVVGQRPSHEVGPLAEALAARSEPLLLVAGASATSDRRDVLPAAVEAAGGRVLRVGMPVDPGNLLVLAEMADGRPVIGLPGCARSPARNGFDLVLERVAAGLPLSSPLVAAMGVGGLFEGGGALVPWIGPT